MRQLMQCRAVRSICYALIIALVSTIAPVPLSPARAQLMPTYSVGVVEFVNESGVQGDLLARLATDAVVVEMSKTSRYDVSITRTQIKSEMEKLDLHMPLSKIGLVRLGEALSADAMLEGAIKSVQLAGSGATRRATVTLAVQMIDQASGEILNGAVQTGTSSARVGYAPDDDALIVEAVNNAAFLAVKTMVDYVIPEATIQMNIGEDQVMLNKGVRDGLKPGMRMIVLRNKEIIGYIDIRTVSPNDSEAKVIKSMRGIQPEDKARAIFDMPNLGGSAASAPLPTGAPAAGKAHKGTISKIGKFLLGAGIVFGLASLFKSGRGSEDALNIGASDQAQVSWDPSKLGHGTNVLQLQILRDSFDEGARPVKVLDPTTAWDLGKTTIKDIYGVSGDVTVNYLTIASNPATSYSPASYKLASEPYGTTHSYQVRVLYKVVTGTDEDDDDDSTTDDDDTSSDTEKYYYTPVSNTIVATAIEPVRNQDVVSPAYVASEPAPEIQISDLQQGITNLQWNRKDGADIYYVKVEPVIPGSAPSWNNMSSPIYETNPTISLPAAQRISLAATLANYSEKVMKWTVYCRHISDTSQAWVQGEENRFVISGLPPAPNL
ncbi:MAG: hypothetical protein ABFD54_11895 [Armatimonadota bacterium]|nr:CsgG/HfaB family protein [bacterium]